MAALTLLEAAKLSTGDVVRSGIIEIYAGSSGILEVLPFIDIPGNALKYNREAALPGIGFRGVNEAYTASTGVLNPITEVLTIAGGDLDVDRFIVATMGVSQRSSQELSKTRALGLAWTGKFITGNSGTDPRDFDGLETRVTGAQKIVAGSTANGSALSLAKLDEAIDQTLNPTHLIMNKNMRRRITAAARKYDVGGYITITPDAFGRQQTSYNGLPIITIDLDGTGAEILGFDEACSSGTDTGTSIYVASFSTDGVIGLQNRGMQVTDLGELQTAPVYRTRVEWYSGLAVFNGRAVTRLWSLGDLAVVV